MNIFQVFQFLSPESLEWIFLVIPKSHYKTFVLLFSLDIAKPYISYVLRNKASVLALFPNPS